LAPLLLEEIAEFLKSEFPYAEFEESTHANHCRFKIISFGRVIGRADYELE